MKNFRNMFLLTVMTMVTAVKADEIDLNQYLRGDMTDENGQTILHLLAQHCDKPSLRVSVDLFDLVENIIPQHIARSKDDLKKFYILSQAEPELATLVAVFHTVVFVNKADKNGETALDVAKRREAVSSHERSQALSQALEVFTVKKSSENQ